LGKGLLVVEPFFHYRRPGRIMSWTYLSKREDFVRNSKKGSKCRSMIKLSELITVRKDGIEMSSSKKAT